MCASPASNSEQWDSVVRPASSYVCWVLIYAGQTLSSEPHPAPDISIVANSLKQAESHPGPQNVWSRADV